MEASTKSEAGRIEEIKGVVIDAAFSTDDLPDIYNALEVDIERDGEKQTLVCEVQQHLGDDRVRAVAMDATDGLARGVEIRDTGGPITVPGRQGDARADLQPARASRSTTRATSRPTSAGRSTATRPRSRT